MLLLTGSHHQMMNQRNYRFAMQILYYNRYDARVLEIDQGHQLLPNKKASVIVEYSES